MENLNQEERGRSMESLVDEVSELTQIYRLEHTEPQPLSSVSKLKLSIIALKSLLLELQSLHTMKVSFESEWKRLSDHPSKADTLTTIDLSIQGQFQVMGVDIEFGSELLKRIMDIVQSNMMVFIKEADDVKNHQSVLLLDIDVLTEKVSELEKLVGAGSQEKGKQKKESELVAAEVKSSEKLTLLEQELQREKQKRVELERTVKELTIKLNQTPNERVETLASELLVQKKRVKEMMKMTTTYQSKTIDLQLQNQGLMFQINTYKSQLEDIRSPKIKRQMTESVTSAINKLSNSSRWESKGQPNKLTQSILRHRQDSIRQVSQIDLPLPDQSMKKSRPRIFNQQSKLKKSLCLSKDDSKQPSKFTNKNSM